MKKTNIEFFVGIFVLCGLAAIAYLTVKLGSGSLLGGETYLLEARFANAGGLHQGASVLVSGVTVGRVESVRMDPADYSAIATIRVASVLKIPTDSMASIKTSGLIGDKFIAIAPGADDTFMQPGERITLTESSVDLESLISKMAFGSVEKKDNPEAAPEIPTTPHTDPETPNEP